MSSYSNEYRQTHYAREDLNQLYPSLPSSSPPPYHSQPSAAVRYCQDLNTSPSRDSPTIRHQASSFEPQAYTADRHEPSAPRTHTVHYNPAPVADRTLWNPYEPVKRRHDELHHSGDTYTSHSLTHNTTGREQGQAGHYYPKYHTIQSEYEPSGLPRLPGVEQYLQRRNNQEGRVPDTTRGPSDDRNGTMYDQASGSGYHSLSRSQQASGPPYGSQHTPLEILSSPEPETKRRRTANHSQTAQPYPHEASRPTEHTTYDGFSKQERTKALAESTNVKPSKMRYYAVAIGREPGVYFDWPSAEKQVHGYFGAKHKKFKDQEDAIIYIERHRQHDHRASPIHLSRSNGEESFDSAYYSNSTSHKPIQPSWQHTKSLDPGQNFVHLDEGPMLAPDDGPKLVPEQQHVVDLIMQGRNVFYTGSAGCGKSTILKVFVKQLQAQGKKVKIVAPTNLAALNVGGQTTWNFAGWTPDSMKIHIDKLMSNSRGKESWKKFDETDVLVIDEISMIENLQFERLNMILKASRGKKYGGGAFGGIQLIVTGDFYQLAPVKPFGRCMCGWELERDNQQNPKEYKCTNKGCREHTFYDIDKWAFRSRAWEECNFKHVNLTQIHRQSDMMFKSILNKIRTAGTILKPHAKVLLNHTSETEGAIELYARRVDVDRVNNENINRIQSAAIAYKCLDHFDWPEEHREDTSLERNTYRMPGGSLSSLKEHRFETNVQLKSSQRVVLQANLEPSAGLVNGAQGTIIEFKEFDENALPKAPTKKGEDGELRGDHAVYRQHQIRQFADVNGRQPWPVVRFTNGVTRTIFADCTVNLLGNDEPYCRLSRTQIPLAAGYAITVHKSQGMTLDRVIVDLARAFETSQIYVALSRARSLKGLTVSALPRNDLGGANAQVTEFMENIAMRQRAEAERAP